MTSTPISDMTLHPTIVIGGERFSLCTIFQKYIHYIRYNNHVTQICKLDNFILSHKGDIECMCGQSSTNKENYIIHLNSILHVNSINEQIRCINLYN